jgi:RNA polymerase sigma factor (sigma-70 family)
MEVIKNFPDSELLSNIRNGTRMNETIKAIYRSHFESLSWFIINNNGSRQDAEDVFQEVVVNFIGESTVKTFLFSLNRFTWLNELKRRGRALAREEKYEKGQDKVELDTSHFITEREEKGQILRLVGELGDTCKRILLLFYYENLSMKEILNATDYENEQVVRNKKYKCLKQLEKMINENPSLKATLKSLLHG